MSANLVGGFLIARTARLGYQVEPSSLTCPPSLAESVLRYGLSGVGGPRPQPYRIQVKLAGASWWRRATRYTCEVSVREDTVPGTYTYNVSVWA